MFTQGFDKTAALTGEGMLRAGTGAAKGVANAVKSIKPGEIAGKAVGTTVQAPKQVGKSISQFVSNRKKSFSKGFQKAVRPNKPEPGAGLAKEQIKKVTRQTRKGEDISLKHNPAVSGRSALSKGDKNKVLPKDAKQAVLDRHKQMRSGQKQRAKGPSFAMRHPFMTAGAGLVAGKAMFGDKKEESQPSVVYPQ